jgi:hypothetical protein
MPQTKKIKAKAVVVIPKDEDELEAVKPKEGVIEIPEDDDKVVDPDALADDLETEDAEEEDENAVLDVEEVDPFGDKWEQ